MNLPAPLIAKAVSWRGVILWRAEGSDLQALMRKCDQEAPECWTIDIRSDRTSDGTVWGPGGGRLLASRNGSKSQSRWLVY